MSARHPVAVLISGRGSNLKSLIAAAKAPDYPAHIALVLSDNPDAGGLEIARDAGIEAAAIPRADHKSRAAFEAALHAALQAAGIHTVALAGFMRILSAGFVAAWAGKILNIHPSLLPSFRGLDTHARALEAGVKLHGATVHIVTPTLDDGPILAQAAVPVLAQDDAAALAARVLRVEHQLYPAALAAFLRPGPQKASADVALFSPPLPG